MHFNIDHCPHEPCALAASRAWVSSQGNRHSTLPLKGAGLPQARMALASNSIVGFIFCHPLCSASRHLFGLRQKPSSAPRHHRSEHVSLRWAQQGGPV